MKAFSSIELIKILTVDGWYEVNCVGDHHQYKHPTK
ncbi:MAG: type II toxin-antitoxin system HicA family toxin, partial [Clostridium sp.]